LPIFATTGRRPTPSRVPIARACRVAGLLALASLAACGPRAADAPREAVSPELQRCQDFVARKAYAAAVPACAGVFQASRDPRAGAALVRTHYALQQWDAVIASIGAIAQTDAAKGLWQFAAYAHLQRGEQSLAAEAYRRDAEHFRATGDHSRAAGLFYRVFHAWWELSRHREALVAIGDAVQEASNGGTREQQQQAYEGLHGLLYDLGDLEGAERAIAQAERFVDPADAGARVRFLTNKGALLLLQGRLALARQQFERALTLADEKTKADADAMRAIHLNLVDVLIQQREYAAAARHLEDAWRHTSSSTDPDASLFYYQGSLDRLTGRRDAAMRALRRGLKGDPVADWAWKLEYELAQIHEQRGQTRDALAGYERAARQVEALRERVGFDGPKTWLWDTHRAPFESLFVLHATAGRAAEALATAERVMARTFLDAFLKSSAAPAETSREWSLASAASRFRTAEALVPIRSESPMAAVRPVREVLAAFGRRQAFVYVEARDQVWQIRISGQRPPVLRRLAGTARDVNTLVQQFLQKPEDAATADRLGAILLPPGSEPANDEHVYIIADGPLANLPFAALRRDGRYLAEARAVSFAPSLNALVALEARARTQTDRRTVLANPRGDLPAAGIEGPEVARLLHATLFASAQATFAELVKAGQAETLHLATHAGVTTSGPWLRLADRDATLADILEARIGPRLVVLASCASAVKRERQMWGSLAAAFLAAGTRSVVASLWSVDDRATRDFVLRFYAEGGVTDPAGALARAQRVAIARGESPSAWAPFVVQGSGEPSTVR